MQVDLHVHTRFGSNCSYMFPGDLGKQAKAVGLDAICITEHDMFWEKGELAKLSQVHDVLILGGVEVSTEYGDILVYGLRESVVGVTSVAELRRLVDDARGVMIAAHPFRRDLFHISRVDVDEVAARPIF
ncbi:MAG: PHP domain-containing protein, partial [Dehalococcoidia bacterium]|nr:PHP domain-containing protein [Dehalococcoidia bacterium]